MLWLFVLVTIPCGMGGRASPGLAHCELPKKQRDLNSFLWRVHRDPPAFLFGTIHVSYDLVWPFIPKNAKRALEQSHDVYFELELGEPATLGAIASCQKLPQGQRLREVLPASLYTRLKTHLDYVHFMLPTWLGLANRDTARRHAEYLFKTFVGDWERKRPVWLLVLLNWLTEADVQNHRAPLLDVGLAHMAAAGGKRTGAVERPEEQCLPLNMLSPSKVLFALNHTLQMQEMIRVGSSKATNSTKELINNYNCGDLSSIIFQQEPSQVLGWIDGSLSPDDAFVAHSIDHYLRQELIYKRNARMAQRVYSLLLRHPDKSFFFAFGVANTTENITESSTTSINEKQKKGKKCR
uniref:Metalloprotease TIKI n=1 Tax=Eptatretus burgeri TaxID=7764 RepID=A0A8C4QCF4_EPTBU